MKNKVLNKFIILNIIGTIILSSEIKVYAVEDVNIYDEIQSNDNILQDNNLIKMEVNINRDVKIDNDKLLKIQTKNCTNIKIKNINGELILEKHVELENKWIESIIDISKYEIGNKVIIEFNNNVTKETESHSVNIMNDDNKLIISNKVINNKSCVIKGSVSNEFDKVYALIDEKRYDGEINFDVNEFEIIIEDINDVNIKDNKLVKVFAINNENNIVSKNIIISSRDIKINKESILKDKLEINNKNLNQPNLKLELPEKEINIKINELNNNSNKFRGKTEPNSKVIVNINGFDIKSISDDSGNFEIGLFYKRKENTKVIITVQNDKFKEPKIITTYIQDKKAPKKPYIRGSIKENDISLKGKAEKKSKILVQIKEPTHVVKDRVIDVRDTPIEKGLNKIGILLKDDKVVVLDESKEWCKIEFKETIGYLKRECLDKIADKQVNTFEGMVDDNGNYEVIINKQTKGSIIRVVAEDKSGNKSNPTVVTVEKE